jgi:hypothetical protein
MENQNEERPKLGILVLVCAFAGTLGLHRKMLGYPKWWLHIIATCCCLVPGLIWAAIDQWRMIFGSLKYHDGTDIKI